MSMLDNAVESIRMGVADYRIAQDGYSPRALSAIRNLTSGLLLLFKVKLQELSPEGSNESLLKSQLVLQLDDDGAPVWIGKGDNTVNVDELIKRLSGLGITGIEWPRLKKLQAIRNDVEHYYTTEPESKVLEALAASFHLIQQFVPVHLNESPADLLGEEVWYFIVEQEGFYEKELAECRAELAKVEWPLQAVRDAVPHMSCPECQSELIRPENAAVEPPSTSFICTKCDLQTSYEGLIEPALAESFAGADMVSIMQGGEPGLVDCYECGLHTFVVDESHCAACLVEAEEGDCWRCGNSLTREELHLYENLCSYCNYQSEKAMRDD